jgi:hypothetical protein
LGNNTQKLDVAKKRPHVSAKVVWLKKVCLFEMHLIDSQMGFIKKYMLKVVATMWLSIGKNILKIELDY